MAVLRADLLVIAPATQKRMSRDTQRVINRSPNADHALVLRSSTGTVQSTSTGTGSTNLSATNSTTMGTVQGTNPNLVLYTSAVITIQSGDIATANTDIHLTISRDGSSLTNTTISAANADVTFSTSNTLTTPANSPQWTMVGDVASGTVSNVSWTVSREQRVA